MKVYAITVMWYSYTAPHPQIHKTAFSDVT